MPKENQCYLHVNNCFRHIFSGRESFRSLQMFCRPMPLFYLIDQSKLLLRGKMYLSDNVILYTLLRMVCHRFMAVGSTRGVSCNVLESVSQ